MQFTTQVPISKSDSQIDYDAQIMSLGSCFAVNIAEKFKYFGFRNTVNPFGILFHPQAIAKVISMALNQSGFKDEDLVFNNDNWYCFHAHSEVKNPDKSALLANLNQTSASLGAGLRSASHLFITLGTSWVYRNNASGSVVANCHKIPQNEFSKELLSREDIAFSLNSIIRELAAVNPNLKIIFTISPVRHLKDGFEQNQVSKSNLISAVHSVVNVHRNTSYFPAYEIMMDELRDYRFYAADMIHPSQTAIDYIWERFSKAWISDSAAPVMLEVDNIRKGLAHKAFSPESGSHTAFLAKISERIAALKENHPNITL